MAATWSRAWPAENEPSAPDFQLRGNLAYRSVSVGPAQAQSMPEFEVRGRLVYRSSWHPEGPSEHPMFEIRGRLIFRTAWNETGAPRKPEYVRELDLTEG